MQGVIGVVGNLTPKVTYFESNDELKVGDFCIAETERGVEFLKVVEINSSEPAEKKIIRKANFDDIAKNTQNLLDGREIKPRVEEKVKEYHLDMKVSVCEYTFDKSKLIVHYTADNRVDFRELIKDMASEFKVRIEMHQISSRDETQIVGAIGCCGRVCCCKNHLTDFDKVSIKMAKRQGLSLNPQKLNGICGKLLCCLKYEDDYYAEALSKMPKVGSNVETNEGAGVVKSLDCIKNTVSVSITKNDETELKVFPLEEIKFKGSNDV